MSFDPSQPFDLVNEPAQQDQPEQQSPAFDPSQPFEIAPSKHEDIAGRLETMHNASSDAPDQVAKHSNLAKAAGVTYEVAKAIPDDVEKQVTKPDWIGLATKAPKTAQHLTEDHVSFQILKNDVQKLAEVEQSRFKASDVIDSVSSALANKNAGGWFYRQNKDDIEGRIAAITNEQDANKQQQMVNEYGLDSVPRFITKDKGVNDRALRAAITDKLANDNYEKYRNVDLDKYEKTVKDLSASVLGDPQHVDDITADSARGVAATATLFNMLKPQAWMQNVDDDRAVKIIDVARRIAIKGTDEETDALKSDVAALGGLSAREKLILTATVYNSLPRDKRIEVFSKLYESGDGFIDGAQRAGRYLVDNPGIVGANLMEQLPTLGAGGFGGGLLAKKAFTGAMTKFAPGVALSEAATNTAAMAGVNFGSNFAGSLPSSFAETYGQTGNADAALSDAAMQSFGEGLGNALFSYVPGMQGVGGAALGSLLGTAQQAAGGATGAYLGGTFTGKEVSPGELFAEAALEIGSAPIDYASGAVSITSTAGRKAIVDRIDARKEAKKQAVITQHNSLLGEVQKVESMDSTHLDPLTVRNALESIDGDNARSVYVDPSQLLNQEGLSRQQVEALMPSVSLSEINQALQVGGTIKVPRNELITNLAATKDLDNESITRHFKEDPTSDSKYEMEMSGIDDQIKQADILIARSADSEKLKTQRGEVYQQALKDLNESGMFKGGNDKRASIWAAMATATAIRTGMAPMDLYKQAFGRVTDEAAIGDRFNQYAGQKAQGADLTALQRAKQAVNSGADAEQTRQETGWFRGPDNKWRFEIDDSKAVFKGGPTAEDAILRAVKAGESGNPVMLADVLRHESLFAAYPELKNIEIRFTEKGDPSSGAYSPEDNVIAIRGDLSAAEAKSTLLHEIQHTIQRHEGFAVGGSYKEFTDKQEFGANVEKLSNQISMIMEENPDAAQAYRARNQVQMEARNTDGKYVWTDALIAKLEAAEKVLTSTEAGKQLYELDLERSYDKNTVTYSSAFDQYRKLHGEIEARDTQARADMNAEDRKASKPYISQGIPDDQVIVRFGGNGQINSIDTQATQGVASIVETQINAVRKKYEGTSQWMKAPNGEPTKLNEMQWLQVRTPNFKAWFGDFEDRKGNYSAVIDRNGEPLVVRHYTSKQFDVFDISKSDGFWFTDKESFDDDIGANGSSRVIESFLNIRDPEYHGVNYDVEDYLNGIEEDGIINTFESEDGSYKDYAVISPTQIKSAIGNTGAFDPANPNIYMQNKATPRGTYDPSTRNINLTHNADLSTFLHESGHMFLDIMVDMSLTENASESLKKDMDVTMRWFGIDGDTPGMRLYNWSGMSIKEKRQYHEKWAESFEQYLFEGKAPSIELAHVFSSFRQWLLHVYKSNAQFVSSHDGAKLNDEMRGVFDRMLATEEQIAEAEAARGMLPLFDKKPDNMTEAEWAVMRQAADDYARSAFDQMTARSLRDMKWLSNAKNKTLRKLQREADAQRREAHMEARQRILSQNIYRAWQFLKAPVEGAAAANKKAKASKEVDSSRDSLLTAIAKMGGLNMEQAVSQYGLDNKDFHHKGGMFGMPVLRKTGGMSPDAMGEALSQYGYLPLDEHGKWDIQDLEDKLREEAAGNPQYSDAADYDVLLGDSRYAEAPTPEEVDFVGGRLSRQAIREMYDDADLAGMQGEQVDTAGKLLQEEKYKPDLFVAHNLTAENLVHSDELGGLAAPSLGVSRTTTGGFTGFGEITLLADKSILTDRDARTFDADVYSPRHPRAQENISYSNYIDLVQRIKANQGEVQGLEFRVDHDSLMRNGAQDLANSEAFQNYYLVSKGIIIKPKKAKAAPAILKAIKYLQKNAKYDSAYESYNLRGDDWFKALAEEHYAAEFEKWKSQRDDFTPAELVKYGPFEEDGSLKYKLYNSLAMEVEHYHKKGGQDSAATRGAIAKHFRTDKGSAELQEFANAELEKISSGKQLVKYTKNGNAKYSAYNLDNIVAEMTRELQGGEGFNYGAGSVRSAFAFEFKHNTIESIKSFKGGIVSKEEMDKIRTEANDKLGEALDKLRKFYKYDSSSFGYSNDASSAIAEGPKGQAEAFRMTAESKAIIKELTTYLRELPSEYFETKMQRAVGIGEFKAAIVPKGTSQKVLDILANSGISRIEFYNAKDQAARTKAIAKQKDLLFQPGGKDSNDKRTLESMGVLSDEGLHPDTVADLFGLSSGDELVRKLLTMPDPVAEIERLTDEIMLQRHADLATPEARERAAEAAIHNEAHVRFLATELTALNRAIGKPRMVMAAAKEYAAQIVSGSLIKDLNTGKYEAAEVKAGRAAEQAFRSGNKNEAALQKRNQVLHAMTVKMVNDAKDEMEKHLSYLKKFDKFNKKIDPDYQEQIDTLLERYDLRKKSLKAIQRSQNLGQWIEQQKAMGLEPVIPDKLLDESQRTNYKLLTVEEMRGLVDAVKNIEHLGRLKNRLLTDKAKRELNALADAVGKSISDNGGAVKPVKIERNSTMDRLSDLASGFFSMHRKLANIVRQLDGWKDGGLLWETMIRPMNEAGDNEAVMHEKSTLALAEVFAPLKGKKLTKKMYIPMIANSLSYEGRLAVALNWGNEGNRQRLMDGDNWGVPEVGAILATLTADDWKFVQGVWDHIATYKDAIGEQQKRLTGIEPSWVDATPFEIKSFDGQMVQVRGGYYPAKYDTTRSTQALSNEAAGNVFDQWKAAKGQGKTRDGFTKSRATQVVDRPIRKDFGVITQHITEVTHRLAWQDWVVDMNRLLKKEQVDSSIRAHYGNEILEEMRKAIEDITTGDMTAQSSFEKAINHLRIGTTIVGLGYNLTTSLLQPFGLTQSMVRIGPKWVAKGLSTWIGNPARMNERTEWVYSKSDFMRLRGKTMMREMNEILNAVRKGKLSKLEASYFYGIQKMQVIADMPTWLGQYEKSMAEFDGDESKAIALADQAVLDAQGGGQNKDLSRIQRGGPLLKLWTNFYSFFNTTYNLTREVAGRTDVKDPASVAKAAVDMLLLYSIPAVMGSILKGVIAGDDDDDELADRILRDQMSYLFGTMVGLREISAAFSGFNGYQGPAGTRFFSEVAKFGKQAEQGEADAPFLKSLNNIGGIIFHYPAGQINRTVEGANALMDGETDNMSALIFGKPK